jgi:hypothetical protein
MTFAVKVAAKQRPKYGPNLIYSYPGPAESELDAVEALTPGLRAHRAVP